VLLLPPLSRCVTLSKFNYFFVLLEKFFHPSCKTKKKNETASDDTGGKSLSDTSTSGCAKSTVIRTSVNIFEVSKRDKPEYFVDKVKDKRRTKNNNLEFHSLDKTFL
jgi:hypothetical protein